MAKSRRPYDPHDASTNPAMVPCLAASVYFDSLGRLWCGRCIKIGGRASVYRELLDAAEFVDFDPSSLRRFVAVWCELPMEMVLFIAGGETP